MAYSRETASIHSPMDRTNTPLQGRTTTLPPEAPENLVMSLSMNRWNSVHPGPLPRLIGSVNHALKKDGIADSSWVLISDASDKPGTEELRRDALQNLHRPNDPRLFLLTPETQTQVAKIVANRTGIHPTIVRAILQDTGYASQRIKLDTVAAGLTLTGARTGPSNLNVLSLDDDTVIPDQQIAIHDEALRNHGLAPQKNSQTLLHDQQAEGAITATGSNTIRAFFEPLGKSVQELREAYPQVPATKRWIDTMHTILEEVSKTKKPAQFVVTHANEPDIEGAPEAKVVAVSATKHGKPDYRTVRIAQADLENEFPQDEIPMQSFPSGLNQLFAFMESTTNVDSAAFARQFNEHTAFWPWWFVSSDAISKDNPSQTVTGHYRADNELLPVLNNVMQQTTGKLYMFVSGIDTQVYHDRARSGYRPDIIEQASASLVGNIAALEAARRIELDRTTGNFTINRQELDKSFQAPQEHVRSVFSELQNLSQICQLKGAELEARVGTAPGTLRDELIGKIAHYQHAYKVLRQKLAGFDFDTFSGHLNTEVRRQVAFFADVLDAMPTVITEVQNMVHQDTYPVREYVPVNQPTVNYPTVRAAENTQFPTIPVQKQTAIFQSN